jgi:hypothetical protein
MKHLWLYIRNFKKSVMKCSEVQKMANEKRLIDANKLGGFLLGIEQGPDTSRFTAEIIRIMHDVLNAMPTVDAVEVVHGEWNIIEDDYVGLVALQCSKCNEEYWFEEELPTKGYNYCPNCGAKMDGDGNA